MTNLSKKFREKLSQQFHLHILKLKQTVESSDGETIKFLWELFDGAYVESVLIRAPHRRTLCVSSQVGCPARCAFCASGKQGWIRNLDVAEILEQILLVDHHLAPQGEAICHVVFMGMGEPLENYDHVLGSIRKMIAPQPHGLGLSQRRITVSTVGIEPQIRRFAEEGLSVNLVLSLHAPNQTLRQRLIPYARKYPLSDLLEAMLYFARTSGRNITYEYTLIQGMNDSLEHARELAQLIRKHPCTVNLIPYNPIPSVLFRRPSGDQIQQFRDILVSAGIPTTWRHTKGKDVDAACGQLALKQKQTTGK